MMPEVRFRVRWPDGGVEACYSPSTIIKTYFEVGVSYSLARFVELSREGLQAASERVRSRYGGAGCTHALAQIAAIEAKAKRMSGREGPVRIEGFDP